MGLLIATPSLLLGSMESAQSEIAALMSIIVATATFLEYRTAYPSFVEFRDAPPINRIRFVTLFLMVFLLTITCKHQYAPNNLTGMVSGISAVIGEVLDFPFSPIRMVLLTLPTDVSPVLAYTVRSAAGLCYLIAALSIGVFFLVVRIGGWPVSNGAFNVWVNMPLFDPTAGRDVVRRLQRDGRVSIIFGVLLPFMIPAGLQLGHGMLPSVNMPNPHVMVWLIAGWAFVPASMVVRGIALFRISELIEEKRRRTYANADHMQTA